MTHNAQPTPRAAATDTPRTAGLTPYYQDESCTIYHGDSARVLAEMADGSVDMIVTDPPYFQPAVHYVPARGEARQLRSIGDTSILELAFKTWANEMARVVGPAGTIYFFCDGQTYPHAFTALYPHAKYVRPLVWDKLTSYNGYTWRHQHELIAWAELPDAERINAGDGDILRHRAVPVGDRLHPAEKPVRLLASLIAKHEGALVLDPFMGSGATLAAAKDLGRKAIGIEIEERYCEIAAERAARTVRKPLPNQEGFAV